jgi:hypothetical protein
MLSALRAFGQFSSSKSARQKTVVFYVGQWAVGSGQWAVELSCSGLVPDCVLILIANGWSQGELVVSELGT